jgi:hippurate hydrolase
MTTSNRIAALAPEIAAWRRDLHAHPEIRYEENRTAALVAAKL